MTRDGDMCAAVIRFLVSCCVECNVPESFDSQLLIIERQSVLKADFVRYIINGKAVAFTFEIILHYNMGNLKLVSAI